MIYPCFITLISTIYTVRNKSGKHRGSSPVFPRWGITYLINLSPRTFITYVFPRSFPTKYITKLRMKYQSDVISLYLIFRSPVFPRCFPGVSPLLIIIMKSKSVGCHFISMHVFISVNYYYYLIIIILL